MDGVGRQDKHNTHKSHTGAMMALALLIAGGAAQAQSDGAAKPANAADADPLGGHTPSEAVQRQALSPYRFILNAAPAKPAKPAVAAAPVPAPTPAAPPRSTAPSPVPAVAKATTAPSAAAPEPAKPSAPAVATSPALVAPTVAAAAPAPIPSTAPIQVAAATVPSPAAQVPASLPPPAQVAKKELVPLQQDPPALSKALLAEIPQGLVKVRFDVNPDGSTSGVQVASSSNRKLNAPTIAAVSKWRFQPIDATRAAEIELTFNNE